MKTFKEIVEICSDDSLMRVLKKHLNLIKVVNENYDHIQDLEVLHTLLKGGLPSYYKEHYPLEEEIVQFCAIVAENTRANHYRNDSDKFDDLYTIIEALEKITLSEADYWDGDETDKIQY